MAHKILIVENNSEVRMRVIKMLPSGNYEILEAEDGEEALTQIRSQYPKFVFLNWKLPKINGWEVYQEMQTDQRLHKTAVVMMCRRQDEIAAKIPQAFKYFEYIERPFNKKQLVEAIKSATEKAKQPRSQTSPTTQPKPEPSPTPLAAESEDDAIKAGISSLESAFPQDVSPENLDLSASDFDFNPLEESSQTEPAAEVMANPFAQSEEAVSLSDSASEAATFNPFASTTEDLGMDSFEESGERDVETSDIFAVSPATFDEEEASEQVEVEENIIALGAVSEQAEVESEVSSNQEFDFEQDEAVSSNQEFDFEQTEVVSSNQEFDFEQTEVVSSNQEFDFEQNEAVSSNQEFDFSQSEETTNDREFDLSETGEDDLTLGNITEVVGNLEANVSESDANFEEGLEGSSTEEKIAVLQEAIRNLETATNLLLGGLNDRDGEVQLAAYKQLRDYHNRQSIALALVGFTPYLLFECIHTLDVHSSGGVSSLAISPDRQTLVSASIQGNIQLWNLYSGELLGALNKASNQVTSIAIALDGETLYTSSLESNLKLWNLYTGEFLGPLNQSSTGVSAIAIALDGETLYTGAEETNIKIWNLYNGELISALNQSSSQVRSLAVSPDGLTLVSGSNNNNLQVWDVRTGELYYQLTGHSQPVNGVAVSPDGRFILSGSDDNTLRIWNLQTGELLHTIEAHPGGVKAIAVSPDGQFIVTGGKLDIKIWGVA